MRYRKVDDVLLPTLRAFSSGEAVHSEEIRQRVAAELDLTDSELRERAGSSAPVNYSRFKYLVAWALVHLSSHGLLEKVSHGVYRLTSFGARVLARRPTQMSISDLAGIPQATNRGWASAGQRTGDQRTDPQRRARWVGGREPSSLV